MRKKDKVSTRKKASPSSSKRLQKNDVIDDIEIPEEPTEADIKAVESKIYSVGPEDVPEQEIVVVAPDAPKRPRKKSKASEREHYVNSKEFEERIKAYYATDILTDDLAESINKIANGLSFAPNFINYSYKDEMVGDAIVKMFSALKNKKYRPGTGFSPFSYFTTIAFHAFINRIKKEKKYHEAITEYRERVYPEAMQLAGGLAGAIYIEPTRHDDSLDSDYD